MHITKKRKNWYINVRKRNWIVKTHSTDVRKIRENHVLRSTAPYHICTICFIFPNVTYKTNSYNYPKHYIVKITYIDYLK